jgi:adenylate cyclase class 2
MEGILARPEGLEPPAYWFEASRSIRLSYGRVFDSSYHQNKMSASGTNLEIEVKIPWTDGPADARRLIEHAGYIETEPRTLESDTVFDLDTGALRSSDQLVRLRRTGARSMVTYKGPSHGGPYKTREEIEFDISDPVAFTEVLDRLGYHPRFRYEKYRTKFATQGEPGIISIDETPIGVFLELEGGPEWIDRTAANLGLSRAAYLTRSYASLYQEYLRTHLNAPSDMTFVKGTA